MRTTLLLLLALCLALPLIAEDTATTRPQAAVAAVSLQGLDACATPPLTSGVEPFALPTSMPASAGASLVCDGINYPWCSPGGSCADPCCYCECRALGFGPGYCSLDCC